MAVVAAGGMVAVAGMAVAGGMVAVAGMAVAGGEVVVAGMAVAGAGEVVARLSGFSFRRFITLRHPIITHLHITTGLLHITHHHITHTSRALLIPKVTTAQTEQHSISNYKFSPVTVV
jgi:hypothetical protein